ncbi:serine/threonine-protein phosphatase 6 regulatory subunit 1-like isoform X1 [Erpetoichthys calabaricus]|uniref:serine/threonine-protein phosphatase 6 regulatory subunit 1-like isoform X1 n=1 Tax=Erpetoichthys calabaricus TaxID=27687 RepID=UPI00223496F2|nr:serine/threonine-protein phosphatase 6 regulatory subunit 1-like isoform X1 [Erpetoichthys calabaricus]
MFWKFEMTSSSQLDSVLAREDVVLSEVLDEEDVLQECKVNNRRLLEFLTQPQNMGELVSYITQEPPEDLDERWRFKYPNISCEILTADVPHINDALGDDQSLLNQLYSFLQTGSGFTLNPLLASFFSRVMGLLISRKTEQIISFLRKREDFVDLLLQHIGTSAIMDLLLRLLTCVEQPSLRQEVLNWLIDERIIQRLIDMIHPSKDEEQHCNGSSSLYDIIRLNRDQLIHIQLSPEHDQLLSILEKQETIEQLLSNMFDGERKESVIVNGIQVLLTLLEPRRPRPELGGIGGFFNIDGQLEICHPTFEPSSQQSTLGTLLAIKQRFRDFQQLLVDPPKKEPMKMTFGVLDPPLGNTRLQVVKLLNYILQASNRDVLQELLSYRLLETTLDLFFQYTNNNFLHTQVEQCVGLILSSPWPVEEPGDDNSTSNTDNQLVRHLLEKCGLIQRILTAWEENDKEQMTGGRRRGYMGHLTRIANHIVQSCDKGPNQSVTLEILKALLEDEKERWEKFIMGSLSETNKRNTIDLESTHNLHSSSDDEENELKEFSFPQEAVLQQAFADYQMQQMTSTFIDHFGFNDEEFGEQEDSVNAHLRQVQSAPFDKAANINFSLNMENESPNSNLFDLCCKERIQQFNDEEGDNSDEEDVWQEKELRFSSGTVPSSYRNSESTGSRDSDEEDGEEEVENEKVPQQLNTEESDVENTKEETGWVADFSSLSVAPNQTAVDLGSSVWEGSAQPGTGDSEGWAVFSSNSPKNSAHVPPVQMESTAVASKENECKHGSQGASSTLDPPAASLSAQAAKYAVPTTTPNSSSMDSADSSSSTEPTVTDAENSSSCQKPPQDLSSQHSVTSKTGCSSETVNSKVTPGQGEESQPDCTLPNGDMQEPSSSESTATSDPCAGTQTIQNQHSNGITGRATNPEHKTEQHR